MDKKSCPIDASQDEAGIAMIMVVTLSSVMLILSLVLVATAIHGDESTGRDRNWNAALATAETGLETAFAQHGRSVFETGTPQSVGVTSTSGGQFQALVEKCSAAGSPAQCPERGYVRVEATGWVPNASSPRAVKRKLVGIYGPDPTFRYALFGLDTLVLGNQPSTTPCANAPDIIGDVFANNGIDVGNNVHVKGNLVTHQGHIAIGSNACLSLDGNGFGGSAYSGGSKSGSTDKYGIKVRSGGVVKGNTEVRADCSASLPAGEYNLTLENAVVVEGYGLLPPTGTVNGAAYPVKGVVKVCKQRLPRVELPTLPTATQALTDYAAIHCPDSSYPPCAYTWTSASDFMAWIATRSGLVTGYHYVNDPGSDIDVRSFTVNGDFGLRTTGTIKVGSSSSTFYQGRGSNPDGSEIQVQVIAENGAACSGSNGALVLDNRLNFNIVGTPSTDLPAVLFYTTGCAKVNNKVVVPGALYGKDVDAANNLSVVYNPAVEETVGVGESRLVQNRMFELSAN